MASLGREPSPVSLIGLNAQQREVLLEKIDALLDPRVCWRDRLPRKCIIVLNYTDPHDRLDRAADGRDEACIWPGRFEAENGSLKIGDALLGARAILRVLEIG